MPCGLSLSFPLCHNRRDRPRRRELSQSGLSQSGLSQSQASMLETQNSADSRVHCVLWGVNVNACVCVCACGGGLGPMRGQCRCTCQQWPCLLRMLRHQRPRCSSQAWAEDGCSGFKIGMKRESDREASCSCTGAPMPPQITAAPAIPTLHSVMTGDPAVSGRGVNCDHLAIPGDIS